ncbi:MAG: tRNA uracil 4-sulfurtransferase ThiI [Candidatus Binataceae bacterium]
MRDYFTSSGVAAVLLVRYLIGRYHEIALKGRNRWRFVEQLRRNVRAVFADLPIGTVRGIGPRVIVELGDTISDGLAAERGALLFGLENFSVSYPVALDMDAITAEAIACARGHQVRTFRVSARREEKHFALNSMEIERAVGASVIAALGYQVDLKRPELNISIEIMTDGAMVSAGKLQGPGGLPVGSTGRATALLSGGIDSPVAAYRMMRRGLALNFVHFHSHPLVSTASRDKARELVEHLTRYQFNSSLCLVPFAPLQREIVAHAPQALRVVLYRRFMVRIACALARRAEARALITGESLGQVASQTLGNMTVIEKASSLPMLRPLVGMDKNEIVAQARALGTFETSILPDEDCCSLFVPPHPETNARLEAVERAESGFDVERMVADATGGVEVARFAFPRRAADSTPARDGVTIR